MFIDSRPVTGYGETAGWAISQEPAPTGTFLQRPPLLSANSSASSLTGMEQTIPPTLKRPPFTTTGSSKSSLAGLEQTVPPFQKFMRRTPPVEDTKPLPPTPLRTRSGRSTSYGGQSSLSSREASPSAPRRSSSIYSRTVSQWLPDSPVWSASDLADNPMPPLPQELLRPIAYSASSPELVEKDVAEPTLLQPRTYQSLLTTPSPTISRRTTPSPPPPPPPESQRETRSSILLPTAVETLEISKSHLRTVSLEKAKATLEAPGAEHLLPEEIRAKHKSPPIQKARSEEPLVKEPIVRETLPMFGRDLDSPPPLPAVPTMTLVDSEGRDRVVGAPRGSVAPLPTFNFPGESVRGPVVDAFPVGRDPPRTMLTLADQNAQGMNVGLMRFNDPDYERGRAMQRGPRISNYGDYYQTNSQGRDWGSPTRKHENAEAMALEYHSMLAERYRRASASPASHSTNSDAAVGEHMRMVPQPLFHGKPPAMHTGEIRGRFDSATGSASSLQRSGSNFSTQSGNSFHDRFASTPPNLSISTDRRRRSSIGTIPISPPFQYSMSPRLPMPPVPQPRVIPKHRRNSNDNRVSAYWHIPTKGGNTELLFRRSKDQKPSLASTGSLMGPGVPLLASDIISQRLRTPEATPGHSPLASSPKHTKQHPPPSSSSSKPQRFKEQTAKQAIFSRITKGAAKYAEQLTRPAGYDPPQAFKNPPYEPITLQTIQNLTSPSVREESPHLLATPPSPPPNRRPAHASKPSLGWSNAAKQAFDISNGHHQQDQQHENQPSQTSHYTHVITPARPLDERGTALEEGEKGRGRRGSLFATLRDFRREVKAEKRREEIKRSIRVVGVPGSDGGAAGVGVVGDGDAGGSSGVRGRSAEGERVQERPSLMGWHRRMS